LEPVRLVCGVAAIVGALGCGQLLGVDDFRAGIGGAGGSAEGTSDIASATSGGGGSQKFKRVFVTSMSWLGNALSVPGGDAHCKSIAAAKQLGGDWFAWLAFNVGVSCSVADYYLLDKKTLIASCADLKNGKLDHAINRDENGMEVKEAKVWTGASSTGTPTQRNCSGWTSFGVDGTVGSTNSKSSAWSQDDAMNCKSAARLYCFER
jgi:hypothetical protein